MKKRLLLCLYLAIFAITRMVAQTPTVTVTNLDTFAIQKMAAQPVMKICINTKGLGYYSLEKLVIKPLCQDSTDIDSVAIFTTGKHNRFSFADYSSDNASLVTKRKKFNKDSVIFNIASFSVDTCYLWVVFDLSKTSKGAHYINASMRVGGITLSGAPYPDTAQTPTKQILIWQKYFTENFEKANSDGTPYGWITKYSGPDEVDWTIRQGGFGTRDWLPDEGNPGLAKSGKTNARFAVGDYGKWHEGMLNLVKPIDLTLAVKPLLVFYHAQIYNDAFGPVYQDTMSVYYQLLPDPTWRYMKGYQLSTSPEGLWSKREIVLPSAMAGKKVNLGFKGYAHYGWGVCVDSIVIYETLAANRSINNVEITQPNTNFAPQSSTDNPILRANFRIRGNTGVSTLNSFTVTSGNTNNSDVTNVKLYRTNDSLFQSQVWVATGSFVSGKATFSALNANLETGDNYYWITYDAANNAMPGNILDASILTNDIVTSDGNFPSADQSPTGNRIVKQTIFWDNFETDKNWGLRGDFQRDAPQGLGGSMGFHDPTKAYSSPNVIGNDLTGDGVYNMNLTYATADTATSPLIVAKYFKNVHLTYQRWLNVFGEDTAAIDIKYAGDTNWKMIWQNSHTTIVESNWNLDSLAYNKSLFDRKKFRIRYRLGPTHTFQYSGWNIDDVFFTGDSIKWDASVTKYVSPSSACSLTAGEHIKVTVKNTGPKTLTNIPIKLSIDRGKSWITETIPGPIAIDDSVDYTFTAASDVSKAKIYNIIVKTAYPGDNYPDNDSITYALTSVPTFTLPYQNGFEKDTSFWTASGLNSSWAQDAPGGYSIDSAPEGANCWQTNWSGHFLKYENSYVASPCFNFTGDSIPIIAFKGSYVTIAKMDGAKMEYSLDGGTTWTYLPKNTYPYSWSWYNDTIHAFHGLKGWTGQSQNLGTQIWEQDKQILPSVIPNKTTVRFRFNFKADSSTTVTTDGYAFDDFKVYNAPFDIGVDSILNLKNNTPYCQYEKNGIVQVRIKNYGIRNMHVNDTIIIGVKVDNAVAVVDTFKLTAAFNSNATRLFTMKRPVNIVDTGIHKIKAYTLIEKDPYFYNSINNDADSINIIIKPNPVTGLPNIVASARPDTLQIKAKQVASYQYSWEYGGATVSTSYNVNVKNGAQIRVGDFHLTVTDNAPGNGCVTLDTVTFKLLVSDVGVSKIIDPVTHCSYSNTFKPLVRIKNFGTDTLKKSLILPLQIRLTKGGITGSLVSDNYTLSNKLVPGDSIDITLTNILDLTVPDTYSFMARTVLSNDLTNSNDSSVNLFSIYGMPTVELGPNVYSKTQSYTLPAPLGYSSYLWNDNSTNDTLIVTKTGKYVLTVTNANGCFAKDSVDVMLSIHDLSIKRVISPVTFCSKPGLSTISCKVMNSGTDTVKTSENPVMSYHLNSGTLVTQNLVLSSNLLPGDSVTFTFTQKEDIHLPSTNTFLIKATVGNDLVRANDSVTNIVKVYPNPVISLGDVNQSYNNKESYLLSPGSGYASYVWQDGSSNPDYLITQTHFSKDYLYSVIVTDAFGCMGGDTVLVSLTIKDIRIDSIYLPDETCATSLPLKVKVTNSGNVALNENVPYAYFVNGVQHNGAFHFTADTSSNSQDFTLNDPLDFSTIGSKKIKVELSMQGEVRKSNDTLTHVILAKKGVNIDFGTANDTLKVDLPYTLDPGSGSNYSYVWSTSAITQTITVSTNNLYTVTVTNGICTDSKSVRVIDNIYDFAISNFNVPGSTANSICKSAQKQTATFDIQNNGSVNFSNEPITIKYKLNSGAETSKTINFSGGNLVKNTYPLDDLDLSQVRIDTIRLNLEYAKDKVSSNDSIKQSLLNILEIPTINFVGAINDSIKSATSPITLDPGSGYSYNWYDGSTKQTISTSIQRWHWVTVSNGACAVKDSVYVTFTTPVQTISKQATLITYPNPVQDVLYIDLSVKTNEEITLEFISSLGTIVKTDKLSGSMQYAKTIDVSNLPKGLYYLKLHRKDWVMIEKVVIR